MVRSPFGWSVVAYANAELGIGESGRRIASAVRASGLPTELVGATTGTLSRDEHDPLRPVAAGIGYENAIICVNAQQLGAVHDEMGLSTLRGRRIGLWFWELETFPDAWLPSFTLLHEIWVASEFTRRSIAAATSKPVRVVPLPIEVPVAPTRFTRRSLGLPEDRYVVLTNFDYLSKVERKNPMATIRAYCEAFTPADGACLVIKSINGHLRRDAAAAVAELAGERPDVIFHDGYVTAAAMRAMIELSDVYVSLHRSEGYGLNLADAMACGTPVVATGYSGNLAFMDNASASLVGYGMVEVGPGVPPYDEHSLWADPHVDEAAAALRGLFADPGAAAEQARAARQLVARFSLDRVGEQIRGMLCPEVDLVNGSPG